MKKILINIANVLNKIIIWIEYKVENLFDSEKE